MPVRFEAWDREASRAPAHPPRADAAPLGLDESGTGVSGASAPAAALPSQWAPAPAAAQALQRPPAHAYAATPWTTPLHGLPATGASLLGAGPGPVSCKRPRLEEERVAEPAATGYSGSSAPTLVPTRVSTPEPEEISRSDDVMGRHQLARGRKLEEAQRAYNEFMRLGEQYRRLRAEWEQMEQEAVALSARAAEEEAVHLADALLSLQAGIRTN